MARFTGVLGLLTMLALAYLFSTDRRAIKLKTIAWGLALQIAFAFLVFYWTLGQQLFFRAGNAVNKLLAYSYVGSEFVLARLGNSDPRSVLSSRFRFCRRLSLSPRSLHFCTTSESCRSSFAVRRG